MEQKNIERFAFLFLCGFRDKNILMEKEQVLDDWICEEELLHRRQWLEEFYKNIPDKEIRNDIQGAEW